MVDTARDQARAAVTATVNAVTPQVASAVTAALQKELGGGAGEQVAACAGGVYAVALGPSADVSYCPEHGCCDRQYIHAAQAATIHVGEALQLCSLREALATLGSDIQPACITQLVLWGCWCKHKTRVPTAHRDQSAGVQICKPRDLIISLVL